MKLSKLQVRLIISKALKKQMINEKIQFGGRFEMLKLCKNIDTVLTSHLSTSAQNALTKVAQYQGFPFCDFINVFFGDVPRIVTNQLPNSAGVDARATPGVSINPSKIRIRKAADRVAQNHNNPVPSLFTNHTSRFFPRSSKELASMNVDKLNEETVEAEEDISTSSLESTQWTDRQVDKFEEALVSDYENFQEKVSDIWHLSEDNPQSALKSALAILEIPENEISISKIKKLVDNAVNNNNADRTTMLQGIIGLYLADAKVTLAQIHNEQIAPDLLGLDKLGILSPSDIREIEKNQREFSRYI